MAVVGADKVTALLTRPMTAAIEAGETAILAEAQAIMAAYPGASGAKQEFKTAKSRRFFFAALRKGKLVVPYRRSGDLGRAWQIVKLSAARMALVNSQQHAGLVQGLKQAAYHKGTWKNVKDGRDAVMPRVVPLMSEAIKQVFK